MSASQSIIDMVIAAEKLKTPSIIAVATEGREAINCSASECTLASTPGVTYTSVAKAAIDRKVTD